MINNDQHQKHKTTIQMKWYYQTRKGTHYKEVKQQRDEHVYGRKYANEEEARRNLQNLY